MLFLPPGGLAFDVCGIWAGAACALMDKADTPPPRTGAVAALPPADPTPDVAENGCTTIGTS